MSAAPRVRAATAALAVVLLLATAGLLGAGVVVGSTGAAPWSALWADDTAGQIVREIRLPRSMGAWLAGALLGLAGAVAQGLFRNPLADPFMLGSASGAALGVAVVLVAGGGGLSAGIGLAGVGMTGAAFIGALAAVGMTLALAHGVHDSLRLLLAGVVVGVVLGAFASLLAQLSPQTLPAMQAFMLGSTALVGWSGCAVMAASLVVTAGAAWALSPVLDGLSLGESTARSLGLPLSAMRLALLAVLALATGAAVAQTGLVAFVGLAAPHLVRSLARPTAAPLLMLSALTGGVLLLAADIAARGLLTPQELPVGVLTAILGGGYLLWRMHRGISPGGLS